MRLFASKEEREATDAAEAAYHSLLDRLREALERTRHVARRGALLFIDLDNFKTLNDSEGHDTGDAYLVQVAARLSACVEPSWPCWAP